jgi:lipopolysaccharide transport system permease protein
MGNDVDDELAIGTAIAEKPLAEAVAVRPPSRSAAAPSFVIRPTSGWRAVNFRELWRFRELLFALTWREIQVRYKQTVLGAAWAIIQPVMTMVVFTIFFGKLGKMAEGIDVPVPYQIFVYAGLLPWHFFSGSVVQGGSSLIQSERLISKVYFPRLLIPFAAVGTQLVDFAISFAVMLGLMTWYGVAISWQITLLPVLCLGMLLAGLGMGTLVASLSIAYRDFRYVIPFVVQLWMFTCPVIYGLQKIPEEWRLVYSINPMAGIVAGYHAALLGAPIPWDCLAISLFSALALFAGGLLYFRRVERRFADIV